MFSRTSRQLSFFRGAAPPETSNCSESKNCNHHADDPRSTSSGGGHLFGGAANSMGAKEREPLRMGIESQSKHILNIFVHERVSTQILYVTPDKYG